MVQKVSIKGVKGLDLRKIAASADIRTLRDCVNLVATVGGGVKTRPGTRTCGKLPSESVGLFTVDGNLRTVVPAGYADIGLNPPPGVGLVAIGNGGSYPRDDLKKLHNVELYGSTDGIATPYMIVEFQDGAIEHHYADRVADSAGEAVDTFVPTPFEPFPGLVKLSGRLFAASNLTGIVAFNSIVGGARDWTSPADAGFIPVGQNAPGDRTIRGLSHFRQRLVVAFEDSMQLWGVDANPDNITLARSVEDNLNGPGTTRAETLENVLGDTFYLGRGGIRRLATATVEGERRDDQGVGFKVDDLIKDLEFEADNVISLWDQAGGRLLVFFDDTVMSLTYSPSESIAEWTRWVLPYRVTDAVVANGVVFVRDTEDLFHAFDDSSDKDDDVLIPFSATTQFIGKDEKSRLWQFLSVSFSTEGAAFKVFALPEDRKPNVERYLGTWQGVTSPFQRIYTPYTGRSIAFRLSGEGAFQLDSFSLDLQKIGF